MTIKNLFLTAFTLLLLSSATLAQSYQELVTQANESYFSKDYKKSHELYTKAFKLESKNPGELYNGACSAALAGDTRNAFGLLNLAFANGWTNISHTQKDSDLASLHADKRWTSLMDKMQKKADEEEAHYDKPLIAELRAILSDDQVIRETYMSAAKKYGYNTPTVDSLAAIMQAKDIVNLAKVTKILDERGWLGKDMIGAEGNQALFLVIQHNDLPTQQKYLPMMREAVKKGNANPSALALLEDRVALREGKKQIYGSQIGRNPTTNEFYVLPLEDPDHVDQRRAEVELGPLAAYVKNWNMVWDVAEYKKQLPELEKLNQGK